MAGMPIRLLAAASSTDLLKPTQYSIAARLATDPRCRQD
jgi:hypothetical protein